MELAKIKNYLRVDEDLIDDDILIQSLIDSAIEYIQNCTGKVYKQNDKVYELCIMLLVSHWYDNREILQKGNNAENPHSVTALLNHISYCNNYEVVTNA